MVEDRVCRATSSSSTRRGSGSGSTTSPRSAGSSSLMKGCGIGMLRIEEGVTRREWQAFLSRPRRAAGRSVSPRSDSSCSGSGCSRPTSSASRWMPSARAARGHGSGEGDEALERAKRTYAHGVAVARDVVQGVRMGRTPNTRRLKRAIQLIVDQVMENELSITGLTTLRDYDEYTFTHSVNVCIFSVALGKRLELRSAAALRSRTRRPAARHRQGPARHRPAQQGGRRSTTPSGGACRRIPGSGR